jgi:hypothetical protein
MILRLIRGGSAQCATRGLRIPRRYGDLPEYRGWSIGFRLIIRKEE